MTTRTLFTLTAAYALLAAGPALAEQAHAGHDHAMAGMAGMAGMGSMAGMDMTPAARAAPKKAAARHAAARTIQVQVTGEFAPAEIHVKRGEKVNLVFTRTTDRTCATSVHFRELGVDRELPLGKPVTVALTPAKAGKFRFSCGMDMIAGTLVVD